MDQNTKDFLETVNFIKERMLTKDDVRDIIRKEVPQIVRTETKDIRGELTSIRRDLEALTSKVDNIVSLDGEVAVAAARHRRRDSRETRQRQARRKLWAKHRHSNFPRSCASWQTRTSS